MPLRFSLSPRLVKRLIQIIKFISEVSLYLIPMRDIFQYHHMRKLSITRLKTHISMAKYRLDMINTSKNNSGQRYSYIKPLPS